MRTLAALASFAALFACVGVALADAPTLMGTSAPSTSSPAAAEKDDGGIPFLRISQTSLSQWSTLIWGTAGANVFTLTLQRPARPTPDAFLPVSKSVVPSVELAMVKDVKGTLTVYETYTFASVIVTSHATAGGIDSLVFRFAKVVSKNVAASDPENSPTGSLSWNIKQNTKE
jgi:hypothetical protein